MSSTYEICVEPDDAEAGVGTNAGCFVTEGTVDVAGGRRFARAQEYAHYSIVRHAARSVPNAIHIWNQQTRARRMCARITCPGMCEEMGLLLGHACLSPNEGAVAMGRRRSYGATLTC